VFVFVCFISILRYVYIYHNILKNNLNDLQIYLYNINIYFGLSLGWLWVEINNIHTLLIM
jgi:hypothetical protein